MSEMARAVELLGLRACLVQSTMDAGDGLPPSWALRTTDDCIQVRRKFYGLYLLDFSLVIEVFLLEWY